MPRCPECSGKLVLDTTAETEVPVFCKEPRSVHRIEIRRRPAVVAFCSECEFAIEVRP